jgi:hypothetical protein
LYFLFGSAVNVPLHTNVHRLNQLNHIRLGGREGGGERELGGNYIYKGGEREREKREREV